MSIVVKWGRGLPCKSCSLWLFVMISWHVCFSDEVKANHVILPTFKWCHQGQWLANLCPGTSKLGAALGLVAVSGHHAKVTIVTHGNVRCIMNVNYGHSTHDSHWWTHHWCMPTSRAGSDTKADCCWWEWHWWAVAHQYVTICVGTDFVVTVTDWSVNLHAITDTTVSDRHITTYACIDNSHIH